MKEQMKSKCCEECPGDESCENNNYCMCGSEMEGHDAMWCGHSPVSMHEYYKDGGLSRLLRGTWGY
jgi:hypothetical protein